MFLMGLVLLIIKLKEVLLFKLCCEEEIVASGFGSTRGTPTETIRQELLARILNQNMVME